MYFGGNSEMRGYEYLQFVGDTTAFFNAELRFPLIEAMLTPIGVLGGIRGVFFTNMGGGHFDGQQFKWWTNSSELYTPINSFIFTGITQTPVYGAPVVVDGFRLVDARALVRRGPRNLRARLPDSLRLGVEDALQPGLGGRAVQTVRRKRRVPQGEVLGLDRVRLLNVIGRSV